MKKLFTILFVLTAIICNAQPYTPIHPFGSQTSLDSNRGSALVAKDFILLQYKTTDSTKVLGIDSNGHIVLRTKGGATIVDTTNIATHFYVNSQGFLKATDISGKVNKADSNILGGYMSRYLWLADSALIMSNFNLYMRYADTANMLNPYLRKLDAAGLYYSITNPSGYVTIVPVNDSAAILRALINSKVSQSKHTTDSANFYLSLGDTASALRTFIASLPSYGISPTDLTHWNAAYNNYPVSAAFNAATGNYTITLNSGATITTPFDGRYFKISDWHTDSLNIQTALNGKVDKSKYIIDSATFIKQGGNIIPDTMRISTINGTPIIISPDSLAGMTMFQDGSIYFGTRTKNFQYQYAFKGGALGIDGTFGIKDINSTCCNTIIFPNTFTCVIGGKANFNRISGLGSFSETPGGGSGTLSDTVVNAGNWANLYIFSNNIFVAKEQNTTQVDNMGGDYLSQIAFDTIPSSFANTWNDFAAKHYNCGQDSKIRAKYHHYFDFQRSTTTSVTGLKTMAYMDEMGNLYINPLGSISDSNTLFVQGKILNHPSPGPNTTDSFVVFNAACGCYMLVAPPAGGGGSVGGSSTNVQYNNAGVLAGSSQVIIDLTDKNLVLTPNNTSPGVVAAPVNGVKLYSENSLGIPLLHYLDTTADLDQIIQSSIGDGDISWYDGFAQNGTGILEAKMSFGSSSANSMAYSTTNQLPNKNTLRISTTSAAGNSNAGWTNFGTCNTASHSNNGGVVAIIKFGCSAYASTERLFIGYTIVFGGAFSNVDPSTLFDIVAVIKDAADATFQFAVNDGSGVASKTNTGITPNQNDEYIATIVIPSNSTTVYMQLKDITPTSITRSAIFSATTNIPAAGVNMGPEYWINNGSAAAIRTLDLIQSYQMVPY